MEKRFLLKKIDLLNISLTSLGTDYNKKESITSELIQNDIRNKRYSKKQVFTLLIEHLYLLQEIILERSLSKLVIKIVEKHYYSQQKSTLQKYVIKFCYTHRSSKKYYVSHKVVSSQVSKKTQVIKKAIKNIYIITKLKNYAGIYMLIKYLNK